MIVPRGTHNHHRIRRPIHRRIVPPRHLRLDPRLPARGKQQLFINIGLGQDLTGGKSNASHLLLCSRTECYKMLSMITLCAVILAQAAAHPAFSHESLVLHAADERGRSEVKQFAPDELIRKWSKDLGSVSAPKRFRWQPPYAMLITPAANAEINGFEDARNYTAEKNSKFSPDSWAQQQTQEHEIAVFKVWLVAWPGVHGRRIDYLANPADVRDVNFVLLPDGNPGRAIHIQ